MPTPDQIRLFIHENLTAVPSRNSGDELVVICPEPGCGDRSGNRSINVRSGLTSCFRCNKGGPLDKWAKRMGFTVDFSNQVPTGTTIDEFAALLETIDSKHEVVVPSGYVPEVRLPRGFIPISQEPDSAYSRLIGKMARRKRLEWEDLAAAGVGFTRTDSRWEPFAIFPVTEWGRPVYYQGRTYIDTPGESTKQFPTRLECPLSSRYWLYGIDEVATNGGCVILVEAILNVLSLRREIKRRGLTGITPVAVFKHKISQRQLDKLTQTALRARRNGHPVTEWCVMYDGRTRSEVEGGKEGDALRAAKIDARLLYGTTPVSVVDLPDLVDPNDDAALALDCFLKRQPYNPLEI